MPTSPDDAILAPFSGWMVPLRTLPDPHLAHGLRGAGAAVDLTGATVLAPFAGEIVASDARRRRISLRRMDGLEVELSVGIGGTSAEGPGFRLRTQAGDRVPQGAVLADLDAEHLAPQVERLVGVLLILQPPAGLRLATSTASTGTVQAGATPLLHIAWESARPEPGRLDLLAPVSGLLVPLEEVPDPVFSQRLVGDGISIDPVDGDVVAPVAGIITQYHASRHALTLTTAEGLQILIHVGIDTVGLRGAGFTALVAEGDRVAAGQPLLRFDPDRVAQGAASLLTQMLVTPAERIASLRVRHGRVAAGRDVVCAVELRAAEISGPAATVAGPTATSAAVVLPNPTGLHARPAAVLAAESRRFQAEIHLVRLADGQRPELTANARSLVAVMGLATRQGDRVQVTARGTDAPAAVAALADLLAAGCGEAVGDPACAIPVTPVVAPASPPGGDGRYHGVAASPGIAVGRIHHLRRPVIALRSTAGAEADERAALTAAIGQAQADLAGQAAGEAHAERRQILTAHRELLADPELATVAQGQLGIGRSAPLAWQHALEQQIAVLASLDSPLLRERAADLRDVGRRVQAHLAGIDDRPQSVPAGSIVVAEELTPSDTARFARGVVLGFCTTTGGATSHVAILARSLGIPAVCGIDGRALTLAAGTEVVLDGGAGVLDPAPDAQALVSAQARREAQEAQGRIDRAAAHRPAVTRDGRCIEVAANIGGADEAQVAVLAGGDGVGLLRSEFLFDHRATAPTEDEQAAAYGAVADALGPDRTLVIRTLDVGGDKPLPYLPLPREDNPFLGLRGLRVSLDQPHLLRTQVRAILRSAGRADLHLMFPMVTSVDELRAARAIVEEERAALGAPPVRIGVMIEVPAAALLAEHLAREPDFFSIGTNDLTQYILAMDRGHPRLARQADALHPAVLTAIRLTCAGAHAHGRWVGVCGGLAADEAAVPVLLGLGVDELSVPVPAIPAIKAAVARCHHQRCVVLANEVLTLSTAPEVRARLAAASADTPASDFPNLPLKAATAAVARSCP